MLRVYQGNGVASAGSTFSSRFSIDLDGTDERIDLPDISSTFTSGGVDQPFSVMAWVKMDDATTFRMLSYGHTSGYGMIFTTTGSDKLLFRFDAEAAALTKRISAEATGTVTSLEGTWAQFVGTYDGSGTGAGIAIYVNGSAPSYNNNDSGDYTTVYSDGSSETDIGFGHRYTGYSNGKFAELAIIGKELSAAEVTEIYAGGSVLNLSNATFVDDIVAWYRFGDNALDDATGGSGTIRDNINSNHGTPANTEAGDITEDAP